MSGYPLPPDRVRPTVAPGSRFHPAPPPPPPPPPRSGARWWVVVVAVLVALGAGAVAVQQRQTAASWRDRAEATAAERDDALGRGAALQRQLDEVAGSLAVSEDDVADLETRLRELADEKAQAEDTATTVQVERDVFVDLAGSVAGSVAALNVCIDDLFGLLNEAIEAFNRQGRGESVDVGPLNARRGQVADGCNAARAAAASASATADALSR